MAALLLWAVWPASMGGAETVYDPYVTYGLVSGSTSYSVVADYNGDGNKDVAVIDTQPKNVNILFGKAGGEFEVRNVYEPNLMDGLPTSLAVGEFNGDSWPDLVATQENDTLALFLNRKGAGFDYLPIRNVGGSPQRVAVLDFNGDQRSDVAFITGVRESGSSYVPREKVTLLTGKGDGTFGTPQSYALTVALNDLAAADLNGDGVADLVCAQGMTDAQPPARPAEGSLTVFLGNTAGALAPSTAYHEPDRWYQWIAAGDVNGDGKPDLASTVRLLGPSTLSQGRVEVRLGDGKGGLGDPKLWANAPELGSLLIADGNGDGLKDIAFKVSPWEGYHSVYNNVQIGILPGKGDGSFGAPVYSYAPGSNGSPFGHEDLNGDGAADLLASGRSEVLVLFSRKGNMPSLHLSRHVSVPAAGLGTADANRDGRRDLIVFGASSEGASLAVFLRRADGQISPQPVVSSLSPEAPPLQVLWSMKDFNGDGNLDVLWRAGPDFLKIAPGSGDGSFKPESVVTITRTALNLSGNIDDLVTGDYNGDGRPDLAVKTDAYSLRLFPGEGDLTFGTGKTLPVELGDMLSFERDFSGDGRPDLLSVRPPRLSVMTVLADGSVENPIESHVQPGIKQLAVIDFDNDQVLDLIGIQVANRPIVLYQGYGDGSVFLISTFEHWANHELLTFDPEHFILPVVGDFNGDGHQDAAFASYRLSEVKIYYGNGKGDFAPEAAILKVGMNPDRMVAGDFDGDNKPDLAVSHSATGDLRIFTSLPPSPSVQPGDLDGNGSVNVSDAVLALRIAVGMITPTEAQKTSGDLNGDRAIDVSDAVKILQIVVGL